MNKSVVDSLSSPAWLTFTEEDLYYHSMVDKVRTLVKKTHMTTADASFVAYQIESGVVITKLSAIIRLLLKEKITHERAFELHEFAIKLQNDAVAILDMNIRR